MKEMAIFKSVFRRKINILFALFTIFFIKFVKLFLYQDEYTPQQDGQVKQTDSYFDDNITRIVRKYEPYGRKLL